MLSEILFREKTAKLTSTYTDIVDEFFNIARFIITHSPKLLKDHPDSLRGRLQLLPKLTFNKEVRVYFPKSREGPRRRPMSTLRGWDNPNRERWAFQ